MQTLLLPVTRSNGPAAPVPVQAGSLPSHLPRRALSFNYTTALPLSPPKPPSFSFLSLLDTFLSSSSPSWSDRRRASITANASAPVSPSFSSPNDDSEKAKLAKVAKRLENTSRYFKRFGSLGFWGQLVCAVVAAVILSFSVVMTGKATSPATFYATAGGIAAAFISVFWSFGYIRLSDRLRRTASEPAKLSCVSTEIWDLVLIMDFSYFVEISSSNEKAPPRAEVVKSLKTGIVVNLLGMGAALLGMQATVGLLVAKALTSSANPYYQGISPGYSPVLALDVFLVQASANTILSHFLGLVFSLELLRSVTLPSSEGIPIPRVA
ncbi:hypothetical protein HHK36_009850 [Tetracentron sinense]|uniref:Protein TIC 21, chloroplastic n=1 Tax=Tetracentron sinense TaxID=13715 RepID=A0A834ZFY3_TETSI|nr:hypothetical protein HHK36_009850 [Tetracentron sinense]